MDFFNMVVEYNKSECLNIIMLRIEGLLRANRALGLFALFTAVEYRKLAVAFIVGMGGLRFFLNWGVKEWLRMPTASSMHMGLSHKRQHA